jgi:hypothetical protein
VYFEQTGQEPAGFAAARRAAEKSKAPTIAFNYVLALYRRGQCDEARRVLEGVTWKELAGDYLRVCILAEQHPGDRRLARAAYEEMAERYPSGSSALYTLQLLRLLGYKEEAVAASRAFRQQGRGLPTFYRGCTSAPWITAVGTSPRPSS